MKFASSLAVAAIGLAGSLLAAQAGAQEINYSALNDQVTELAKVANDDHTTAADFHDARKELTKILEDVNKSVEGVDERRVSTKTIQLQTRILELLNKIEEHIPSETHQIAVNARSTLPMPVFAPRTKAREAVEELTKLHARLMKELQRLPADEEAVDDLIKQLVLAEEELAWLVGWPYTAAEIAVLKKEQKLTDKVYLSRRERGVKIINEHLRAATESVGREPLPPFVIHAPESKALQAEIELAITEKRGVGKEWTTGTVTLDEKQKAALLRDPNQAVPETVETKPEEAETEPEGVRTWTAGSLTVKGTFVSSTGSTVKLRRHPSGEVVAVPFARLSAEDQAYIEGLRK